MRQVLLLLPVWHTLQLWLNRTVNNFSKNYTADEWQEGPEGYIQGSLIQDLQLLVELKERKRQQEVVELGALGFLQHGILFLASFWTNHTYL